MGLEVNNAQQASRKLSTTWRSGKVPSLISPIRLGCFFPNFQTVPIPIRRSVQFWCYYFSGNFSLFSCTSPRDSPWSISQVAVCFSTLGNPENKTNNLSLWGFFLSMKTWIWKQITESSRPAESSNKGQSCPKWCHTWSHQIECFAWPVLGMVPFKGNLKWVDGL